MFCIINDKELYDIIWGEVAKDQYINPSKKLNLELLVSFNPKLIFEKDIHLLFIDDNEGICGKVTLSYTCEYKDIVSFTSIDQPSIYSALAIKNIDYHINGNSDIHENIEAFEELTQRFYKDILKTALWISRKLSIPKIITISEHKDDHNDLNFFGEFSFSEELEAPQGILGVISVDATGKNQVFEPEAFAHSIKAISYIAVEKVKWQH